jgi:predicted negative regulator of RcsB-dependent stress response
MQRPGHPYFQRRSLFLILTVALLILTGSGILAYTTINNMQVANQLHATATAQANSTAYAGSLTSIAQKQLQSTMSAQMQATLAAQAYSTATAQAAATTLAYRNATATAWANATATARPVMLQNPYPPYHGILALDDHLRNNGLGYGWDIYSTYQFNNCQFASGEYESTTATGQMEASNDCIAEKTNFTNFVYQAQVTILKGNCGGLVWRADSKANDFFEFHVCSDGIFEVYNSFMGLFSSPYLYGPNAAIHKGLGQTNILAVVAIGSTMTIYINGQKIGAFTDNYNPGGQIGLESTEIAGVKTIVVFQNARVWTP